MHSLLLLPSPLRNRCCLLSNLLASLQAGGWAAAALRSATAGSAPPGAAAQSLLDGKAFDAALVAVDAGFALARYAVLAVDHYATAAAEARGEVRGGDAGGRGADREGCVAGLLLVRPNMVPHVVCASHACLDSPPHPHPHNLEPVRRAGA